MFSELVDRAVHLIGRPDCLSDVVYFANETMRDICKRDDWDDDACEAKVDITEDNNNPTLWEPPEGRECFRREEYVEYDGKCEPTRVRPSRRGIKLKDYYYVTKKTFVFAGACSYIKVYYYVYVPWLKYYPKGQRPSEYLGGCGNWSEPAQVEIDKVSNWQLERHNVIVLAGTLARFYASKADPRQQVAYSSYEQGIKHIIRSESPQELYGKRHG